MPRRNVGHMRALQVLGIEARERSKVLKIGAAGVDRSFEDMFLGPAALNQSEILTLHLKMRPKWV